mmetsp:Transcript_107730/g.347776  ORF Transcript_107730/g.347776 Transcript_107730/m.347776 type:complete len:258 (+) Transcript_107730:1168-1941(+)
MRISARVEGRSYPGQGGQELALVAVKHLRRWGPHCPPVLQLVEEHLWVFFAVGDENTRWQHPGHSTTPAHHLSGHRWPTCEALLELPRIPGVDKEAQPRKGMRQGVGNAKRSPVQAVPEDGELSGEGKVARPRGVWRLAVHRQRGARQGTLLEECGQREPPLRRRVQRLKGISARLLGQEAVGAKPAAGAVALAALPEPRVAGQPGPAMATQHRGAAANERRRQRKLLPRAAEAPGQLLHRVAHCGPWQRPPVEPRA